MFSNQERKSYRIVETKIVQYESVMYDHNYGILKGAKHSVALNLNIALERISVTLS